MITYPDLENKNVFITGATRGIGKEILLQFAKQKSNLIFTYRGDRQKADDLIKEVEIYGAKAQALQLDLSNLNSIEEILSNFSKEIKSLDILINNAGISQDQLLLRAKSSDLNKTFDINLSAPILITSKLLRALLKGSDSSIINMSSVVGLMGNKSQSIYSASKAGIIGFTKSTAKEYASKNIRCNAVCPGFIQTEMTEKLADKAKEEYLAHIPLQRFGDVQDVANLVCFLSSSASKYITGETFKIDGGLYI